MNRYGVWIIQCLIVLALFTGCTSETDKTSSQVKQVIWTVDNIQSIGGYNTETMGDPQVVGNAVIFDGDGDRLLVDNNPLYGATEFTIEIVFDPNNAYPKNAEPRFFHIESDEQPDRRITIELRLNDSGQWYLDTFIKAESTKHTLIDESLTHPVSQWSHAAMTYKDGLFTSYVNGTKELSAENVDYLPIPQSAKTSIGARMNKVHWFNGAIRSVAVTHKALAPEKFVLLKEVKPN